MRPQSRISRQIRGIKKSQTERAAELAKRRQTISFEPLPREEAEKRWLDWFSQNGWAPFAFQTEAWDEYLKGRSGLISVPTGSGKSYAAFGGPLIDLLSNPTDKLAIVYVSPLKALARDLQINLTKPITEMGLPFQVELRTGDTTAAAKARMREKLPQILVITPESLALLLTETEWRTRMGGVRAIVLDEWHELLGTKRGSLLELTLARLRTAAPEARTWALSATIANLETAAEVAVGRDVKPVLIREKLDRPVEIRSILPPSLGAFPWFGHSGLGLAKHVVDHLNPAVSTLLFTNTRSQAERWYSELQARKPEWRPIMALHHGSLDRAERERVEEGVKQGHLRLVVATSSLDLGVDFPQVEKVIQIGSTKGLARALQRAGRAFHRPGQTTSLLVCPTHLMEVVEISALRQGLASGAIEEREPLHLPLDVYVQFLLNSAYGEGFTREQALAWARSTYSFSSLSEADLDWTIKFITEGGYALSAYPQFKKLTNVDGHYRFVDRRAARMHKMNMGTILSDSGVLVKFPKGKPLGTIEESFISKLRPGDHFQFGGKTLKLIHVRDMTAMVRLGRASEVVTPVWTGTNLPISRSLSKFMRLELDRLGDESKASPEVEAFRPAAKIQERISRLPASDEVLIESWKNRDGHHLFVFPWEGRLVHEGLGHLAAFRLARSKPNTFSVSANDHGFELLSAEPAGDLEAIREALTSIDGLEDDIEASLNYPELAKRAFREIARVAGLIFQGIPGQPKTTRHLQMSSSLLFDVFQKYEPDHPLLMQAFREVYDRQLQIERLTSVMKELGRRKWIFQEVGQPTPFGFPLLIERMRSSLTTMSLEERIARLQRQWEAT